MKIKLNIRIKMIMVNNNGMEPWVTYTTTRRNVSTTSPTNHWQQPIPNVSPLYTRTNPHPSIHPDVIDVMPTSIHFVPPNPPPVILVDMPPFKNTIVTFVELIIPYLFLMNTSRKVWWIRHYVMGRWSMKYPVLIL